MNKVRRVMTLALAVIMMLPIIACYNKKNEEPVAINPASEDEVDSIVAETDGEAQTGDFSKEQNGDRTLVVYFSCTGTTKGVAKRIATITGADLYEIKAKEDYTEADLNYGDGESRTTKEQNDPSVRPEIGSEQISLEGYKTIYIGYPIWHGQEPRIMDTFVERYDFTGITVIPFCTSGSSGIGNSGKNLENNAGTGNWMEGNRFAGSVSEEDLRKWIEGLDK